MITIKNGRHTEEIPSTTDEVFDLTQKSFKDLSSPQKTFILFCTQQAIFLDVKYGRLFLSFDTSMAELTLDLNTKKNCMMSSSIQDFLLFPADALPSISNTEKKWRNLDFNQKIAMIIMGILKNKAFINDSEKNQIMTLCFKLMIRYLAANDSEKELRSIFDELSVPEMNQLSVLITESQIGKSEHAGAPADAKSGPTP